MSHTPGPWYLQTKHVISQWSADIECIRIAASEGAFAFGREIALVPIGADDDARLIAAAPDLLEALERIEMLQTNTHFTLIPDMAVAISRAAIAKAMKTGD